MQEALDRCNVVLTAGGGWALHPEWGRIVGRLFRRSLSSPLSAVLVGARVHGRPN